MGGRMTNRKSIKCVVWDLDNTLWDGILAEGDKLSLRPGVVQLLNSLDRLGILQSIASKNNADDALDKLREFAIDHLFLYPQINWNAKSHSLDAIRAQLNIGIDTFMFIDDQAFERDEVANTLPDVECIDACDCADLLSHARIASIKVTEDSRVRRQRYQEDQQRSKDWDSFKGPQEAFLSTLDMKFGISYAVDEDLLRAEELTERTNQLNTTGITYSREELAFFIKSEHHDLLVCELTDKYGSYGKIGLALVERKPGVDMIKLLLMSCRIVSRGVGGVLINYLMRNAKERNQRLLAQFKRTDRNRQMLVTFQLSNFKEVMRDENNIVVFENDLSSIPECPPYIELSVPGQQMIYKTSHG